MKEEILLFCRAWFSPDLVTSLDGLDAPDGLDSQNFRAAASVALILRIFERLLWAVWTCEMA